MIELLILLFKLAGAIVLFFFIIHTIVFLIGRLLGGDEESTKNPFDQSGYTAYADKIKKEYEESPSSE